MLDCIALLWSTVISSDLECFCLQHCLRKSRVNFPIVLVLLFVFLVEMLNEICFVTGLSAVTHVLANPRFKIKDFGCQHDKT